MPHITKKLARISNIFFHRYEVINLYASLWVNRIAPSRLERTVIFNMSSSLTIMFSSMSRTETIFTTRWQTLQKSTWPNKYGEKNIKNIFFLSSIFLPGRHFRNIFQNTIAKIITAHGSYFGCVTKLSPQYRLLYMLLFFFVLFLERCSIKILFDRES